MNIILQYQVDFQILKFEKLFDLIHYLFLYDLNKYEKFYKNYYMRKALMN